jgi:hypothetical protein
MSSVNVLIFTELMADLYAYSRAAGAYCIATTVRNAGYTCQVIDFFTKFSQEEQERIIRTYVGANTLFVGFSSTFFTYVDETKGAFQETLKEVLGVDPTKNSGNVLATIDYATVNYPYHHTRMLKLFASIGKINPNTQIVFGGAKSQYLSATCHAYAVGHADQSIVEYLKYLEGKNPFFKFDQINNNQIAFYGDDYTTKFDFPTSTLEWHESDYIMEGETLPIETARGCIFKCKFCAYPLNGKTKNDYIKKSDVLRDEFLKNYYEYGITRYSYLDDTHNDSVEKLEQLHKVVNSLPFELEYAAYLRHDLIYTHKHTAKLLRESGLRSAIFGIETLNHESGKAIGKGLHPEKTKELLYWLKEDVWKNEVATTSGFIVGLPHDTPDTVWEWSQWLLDLDCPLDSFAIVPLNIAVDRFETNKHMWQSDFTKNTEKHGYVLHSTMNWSNQHFTRASAVVLADKITRIVNETNRTRCSGFPLIFYGNLGLVPKEFVGRAGSEVGTINEWNARKMAYVDKYKTQILGQI